MVRFITILILFSLELFAIDIQNLLVVKATQSTIEAEDVIERLKQKGLKGKIEELHNYKLVVTPLPLNETKEIIMVASLKKEFPDAFRLYLPIPIEKQEKVDINQIANSLTQESRGVNKAMSYFSSIPQKDLPIWGSLILLILVMSGVLIKSYLERREIAKLQHNLLHRQQEIEKSISQEKKTIEEKKQVQKEEKK